MNIAVVPAQEADAAALAWERREAAEDHPASFIDAIRYFDPQSKKWVNFTMFPPEGWESPLVRDGNGDLVFEHEAEDWFWQRVLLDWIHDPEMHAYLIYKARQLGITLIWCAYILWSMIYRPGTTAIGISYEEGEAKKLVQAAWAMYGSLHPILRKDDEIKVITPARGEIPSNFIRLKHADGRISEFQAVPATGVHGHGARASIVLQDELAKQKYGRQIYEAVVPAVLSRGGKWGGVSTADGVSNLETGEGNFFHHLYATRKEKGLRYTFLPWNAEPTRGVDWYETVAMFLPEVERARQYPLHENDGFVLSGAIYFDKESLEFYRANRTPIMYSGQFAYARARKAKFVKLADGIIEIYDAPRPLHEYGIAVDTATGRAADYTSADVIDFSTGEIVASLHAKIDSARAATQIHFLGKWYNEAIVCVENQGGYGEALIIALRDGNNMLPAYRRMYAHVSEAKRRRPNLPDYGFPMSPKNRPTVISRLERFLRDRAWSSLPAGHVDELQTFVYKDSLPSPRAQDGCNDDRVMSLAMACLLYDRYGEAAPAHPRKGRKNKTPNKYEPSPMRAGG